MPGLIRNPVMFPLLSVCWVAAVLGEMLADIPAKAPGAVAPIVVLPLQPKVCARQIAKYASADALGPHVWVPGTNTDWLTD